MPMRRHWALPNFSADRNACACFAKITLLLDQYIAHTYRGIRIIFDCKSLARLWLLSVCPVARLAPTTIGNPSKHCRANQKSGLGGLRNRSGSYRHIVDFKIALDDTATDIIPLNWI